MPDSKFLETYPLYRKFEMIIPKMLDATFPKPKINMRCHHDSCKDHDTRPFKMINEYVDTPTSGINLFDRASIFKNPGVFSSGHDFTKVSKASEDFINLLQARGAIVLAVYQCTSCDSFKRIFVLRFSPELDYVQKIGQYPSWDISISKELESDFGEYKDLYQKGFICESYSYGIGAFSYYRRIIEEIIDQLLISIEDIFEDDAKKEEYRIALEKIKQTKNTEEKIALVKDLLPDSLRPDSINPLAELHSILSEGLHGRTDEECLEDSETIRNVMEFLTSKINRSKNTNKKFTDGMKKILDKKSKIRAKK